MFRKAQEPFSEGINPYAGITIREKVCFTHSPKRSLYYVCYWCLQLLVTRMTISDEGWLDDKTDVHAYLFPARVLETLHGNGGSDDGSVVLFRDIASFSLAS